ncbi:hypothetical protein BGZ79_004447, partial [Entomortierella chlamydospora]
FNPSVLDRNPLIRFTKGHSELATSSTIAGQSKPYFCHDGSKGLQSLQAAGTRIHADCHF